jgi:Zn/Cd-binding protein ZinT
MLDRRDIQTLMYCVRLTEISGQWQSGYPVRTPHELECKLAELLRTVEATGQRDTTAAAA